MIKLWLHVKPLLHFPGPSLTYLKAVQNKIEMFPIKNKNSTFPDILLC